MTLLRSASHNIKIYNNNGDGTFDDLDFQEIHWGAYTFLQLAIGEYNYDGYPDIAVATGERAYVCVNQDGIFDPNDPTWSSNTFPQSPYIGELLFPDLAGHGALSLIGTWGASASSGFFVFNDLSDPRPCPVKNFTVIPDENEHPYLHWAINTEDDIHSYRVYRELTQHETPQWDQFVLIATMLHPENSYTDLDILMNQMQVNVKVFYSVRAVDEGNQESLDSEIIRFWGLYDPESEEMEATASLATPKHFALSISPNPFNPLTTISYTLPEVARVNLAVYDLNGRHVATLVNGYRDAVQHEVTFDASTLASGVYIYRLSAGQFNAVGKMVLMK